MANIKFLVRSVAKGKFAKLTVRLYDGVKYDLKCPSGYVIPSEAWNNRSQSVKQRYSYSSDFTEEVSRKLLNGLGDLKHFVLQALNDHVGQPINRDWLIEVVARFHGAVSIQGKGKETLNEYIDRFIEECRDGRRLTNRHLRFGASTIKNVKGFQVQFREFQQNRRKQYDFDDITLGFYEDFVAFFNAKQYSPNTTGRMIKHLKIIMRAAREEGLHANAEIERRQFRVMTERVDNIYLSENELRTLFNLDLSDHKNLDVVRDVFLVGCYTAQRYSDYSVLDKVSVRQLSGGGQVIELNQKKTGSKVVVPIRPELQAILEKYDYTLPSTCEQVVNREIKKIARAAGIVEPVRIREHRGDRIRTVVYEKCDLIKTHTARRSGATNMYLAGLPTLAIMKITGHKTEREFMRYIKVTEEETAIQLSEHPYFRGNK
ncbi:site-specific integrase [uncultured Rikenella sp.]|uniref:site-specific integrase n=2 Tax=uncultured Rikenella sp. TaxID=368003 RepID=UPI002617C9C9|nr:site-specific integrase [uncultured Rikenella sp.]